MLRPRRGSAFVGRDDTMRVLGAKLSQAAEGHGAVMLISGEAGIGKTRLSLELESVARKHGLRVVRGTCFPDDRSVPSAWVIDLVRQVAAEPGDAEPILAEIASFFAAYVPELQRVGRLTRQHDASELSIAQRTAFLFRRLLSVGPMVGIAEDLHWSDGSGIDALLATARLAATLPLVLVATYRVEDMTQDLESALVTLERERLVEEVALAPISRGAVELMVRDLALPRIVDPLFVGHLYALTEGNPFFVEEIMRQFGDRSGARLELGDLDRVPIPRAIGVTVRRGMNQLTDRARRVVEAASVIGQRFSLTLLSAAMELPEAEVIGMLSEAIDEGLVVEHSVEQFAFRHALTREAIYEVVMGWERRRLHRRIAEELERNDSGELSTLTARSDHWFRAEVWDRALHTALTAAESALEQAVPAAAAELFDRAELAGMHLGSDVPLQLFVGRGRALELLGEFDRSRADLERAAELAAATGAAGLVSSTQFDLGWLWSARDYGRARLYFDAALSAARTAGEPAGVARVLNRIGNWHLTSEDPLAGLGLHQEALEIYQWSGDERGIAESLDLIGTVELTLGSTKLASQSYLSAVDRFRELGDKQGMASSLAMLTFCGQQYLTAPTGAHDSDVAERLTWGGQAVELTESIGWRSGLALAMLGLANVLGYHGRYREALAHAQRALVLADELDHRYWRTLAHLILGALNLDILAFERAAHELQAAFSLARDLGSDYWARVCVGFLVPTLLVLERAPEARDVAEAPGVAPTRSLTDTHGMSVGERQAFFAHAELALASGAAPAGLEIVQALRPAAGSTAPAYADLHGRLLDALGRADDARSVWSAALEAARATHVQPWVWRLEARLAKSLRAAGQRTFAAEHVGRAWSVLDALALELPEPERAEFVQAARSTVPPPTERERRKERSDGLTDREREVASHAASGMTNAEIARALSLSSRTVEKHLEHAMGKLGIGSRVQLVSWMLRKDT